MANTKIRLKMTPEETDKLEETMKGFDERTKRLFEGRLFPLIEDWRLMHKHLKGSIEKPEE